MEPTYTGDLLPIRKIVFYVQMIGDCKYAYIVISLGQGFLTCFATVVAKQTYLYPQQLMEWNK